MKIDSEFIDAIKDGNKRRVQIMIKDSIMIDPSLNSFREMIKLAEENIPNLYNEHDGSKLSYNEKDWSESYFNRQMSELLFNFSQERIKLLCEICKYHYKDTIYKQNREEDKATITITKKQVGTSLVVGGTVAAAVGVAVVKPVIIGAGITAAIVGGVLIITDK